MLGKKKKKKGTDYSRPARFNHCAGIRPMNGALLGGETSIGGHIPRGNRGFPRTLGPLPPPQSGEKDPPVLTGGRISPKSFYCKGRGVGNPLFITPG